MECDIASYHIGSYNYMATEGVMLAARDVPREKFRLPSGDAIEFEYTSAHVEYPVINTGLSLAPSDSLKLFPSECRQRGLTYRAPLKVNIDLFVNGRRLENVECVAGEVPVMLKSNRCHLENLGYDQLVRKGEEGAEKGGYFIVRGSEKVVRLLVANKRNYPIAIQRNGFRNKGKLFSEFAVMMRCVRDNHSVALVHLHYLESANISMSIQFRRELFYVPLIFIIKCLTDMNDAMLYEHMVRARPDDAFWASCVTNMLEEAQDQGITNRKAALAFLGSKFRVALGDRIAPWETDEDAMRFLLHYCVCIHLNNDEEKFFCLTFMAQKLITLVKGEILPESPDNPQFQEASVSGHILLLMLRERLENILIATRKKLSIVAEKRNEFLFTSKEFLKALGSHKGGEITRGLEYFLATGTLVTRNGLGLMQESGFSVIAERINYLRFVSHFRAIHRGAFFMEMRTTDVRKLRPEAWGFICPVHTPDGSPCGLLNHVTASCRVVTEDSDKRKLPATLVELGMVPHSAIGALEEEEEMYPVLVDGNFMGYVPRSVAPYMERKLRELKVRGTHKRVPTFSEITLVRKSSDPLNIVTQYPGLYLYTEAGRMIRPVKNIALNSIEYVGIFEQVYLSIIIDPQEAEPGVTMHQELHPCALFSFAGNLIPFPDHNQSPRNVYQCQMGKQTMAVPVHAWQYRADNKMYRIQFPQSPLLKLEAHDLYDMDEYPMGTNACVAVISYTGYDMEDAMVINKGSYERGLCHGTVIKVERINLAEKRAFQALPSRIIAADPNKHCPTIDADGLPIQGRMYCEGDVYFSELDLTTGEYRLHKFKYAEPAFCGIVRIVEEEGVNRKVHALIQWRIQRNPIIGDKFASRHGQKGINSFLWPSESLPFSESGMVPDIIFNPHGFPSRMTIGMMIESMAGKAAAMHGSTYDASPFVFNEKKTAIDHFGQLLSKAGYNYYGNETMYSGVDGREMQVQIFFGIVYYQRLRHMIADKFQVRSTGPVDPITLQPVKGRKKGGGIRFGEMERDALIAHGSAFCLQDRLFNCSDRDEALMCGRCGSLVSVTKLTASMAHTLNGSRDDDVVSLKMRNHCSNCEKDDQIYKVQVPRVFRYLCAELSAVNVKVQLKVTHPKDVKRS